MDDPYPLLLDVERLPWNGGDRRMMARLLISGDQPIPDPTGAAIVWARGRAPLEVVSLHDVPSLLDVLFG